MAKTNNQAVLFLSKLDVVQEVRTWFITPDGKITSFGFPLEQWEKLLSGLCVAFREVSSGQSQTPLPAAQTGQPSSEGATDMTGVTEEAHPHSETGKSLAAQSSRSCTIEFRGNWFERKEIFNEEFPYSLKYYEPMVLCLTHSYVHVYLLGHRVTISLSHCQFLCHYWGTADLPPKVESLHTTKYNILVLY